MTPNIVPTNMWTVAVLARKRGAIGVFSVHYYQTRAEDIETARKYVFDDAQADGLEVNALNTPIRIPRS